MNENKVRKMVHRNLDNIYKQCRKIAKKYDSMAPISLIETLCEKSKIDIKDESEALVNFADAHNKMLDYLYEACRDNGKQFNSTTVTFFFLRSAVDLCKSSYDFLDTLIGLPYMRNFCGGEYQ